MNFKIEDFNYGINEWGVHFQDKISGAIFSVIQTPDIFGKGKWEIAICSKSIKEKNRKDFEQFLTDNLGIYDFEDIAMFQCYIAPSKKLKPCFNSGEIALQHPLVDVLRIRMLAFAKPGFYNLEGEFSKNKYFTKVIQDLFKACSDQIDSFLWEDALLFQILYRKEFGL